MMRYLSRKLVYILSVALLFLFLGYTLPTISKVRNRMVSEYFKHKKFLFNLKRAPQVGKQQASEESVEKILSMINLKPESIYRSETGIEVRIKEVSWSQIPNLVKRLEDKFEILSFSAIDNTGKGIFDVRVVLR